MAEPQPQPEPRPQPAHVTCPSCGSIYAPETRELVTDTGLLAKIRKLEGDVETYRQAAEGLRGQLATANAKILELSNQPAPADPEPRRKPFDFKIGGK